MLKIIIEIYIMYYMRSTKKGFRYFTVQTQKLEKVPSDRLFLKCISLHLKYIYIYVHKSYSKTDSLCVGSWGRLHKKYKK